MSFLAVLTADGGLPIYTRTSKQISKLPFPIIGSLNAVHMFSRLRNTELKRAVTPEEKIIWREYHERIVLILITSNDACNDCHASTLLDNIFAAMAMVVGVDLLLKQGEVLRLQKALVASYPLIDSLLNQSEQDHGAVGDLTCMTDCLLAIDTHPLQDCMNQFLDVADSLYGCLLIKGKVAIASKEWWTLTNQERVLICFYINALPKVLSREVLIYLPTSSPQNSNRLITLHLLRDVEVCVLCSSEPTLAVLEEEAPKIWKNCFDLLKIASNLYPRNFPPNVELDKNILGVMIINTDTNQCVCSVQPSVEEKSKGAPSIEMNEKQDSLRTLYKLVVGTYFKNELATDEKLKASNMCSLFEYGIFDHSDYEPSEYYIYTEQRKSYVIYQKPFQIYIIFNNEIPHFAVRSVSHETLKILKESLFQWTSI